MKKIFLALCFLFMAQFIAPAFADEIIDSQGHITPCKIETVEAGFVEYHKSGRLYSFAREEESPVFNDYVDVKDYLFKRHSISRISGKIIVKDMWSLIIQNDNGQIDIPFYRIKHIGVYKP